MKKMKMLLLVIVVLLYWNIAHANALICPADQFIVERDGEEWELTLSRSVHIESRQLCKSRIDRIQIHCEDNARLTISKNEDGYFIEVSTEAVTK